MSSSIRQLILVAILVSIFSPLTVFAQGPLPPTIRIAGVSEGDLAALREEVRRSAAARGVSERALSSIAERLGIVFTRNGRTDMGQLLQAIDQQAETLRDLQSRLAILERAEDPQIARLLTDARAAVELGELDNADQLLGQAAEIDLAGIGAAETQLLARRTRAAETVAQRGQLALIRSHYVDAADYYAQAEALTPRDQLEQRVRFLSLQAGALGFQGQYFGSAEHLNRSIELYQDHVLPLISTERNPFVWSVTEKYLGDALCSLGALGASSAMDRCIQAYRASIRIQTDLRRRGTSTAEAGAALGSFWARTQVDLGNALLIQAERGQDGASVEARESFAAALTILTEGGDPRNWARAQLGMSDALMLSLDRASLEASIEGLRRLLVSPSLNNSPDVFARVKLSLGRDLTLLAPALAADAQTSTLQEAVQLLTDALVVIDRESAPLRWATAQNYLASALTSLGEVGGDADALRAALIAVANAQSVFTRDAAPARWAQTELNRAMVHLAYVQTGDNSHRQAATIAAASALEVFQEVGSANGVEGARWVLRELGQ